MNSFMCGETMQQCALGRAPDFAETQGSSISEKHESPFLVSACQERSRHLSLSRCPAIGVLFPKGPDNLTVSAYLEGKAFLQASWSFPM